MSDRNQTCQPGRVAPHPDVQSGPTIRQTPFSGQANVPLSRHTFNKFWRPAVLQLNIKDLTANKINVLLHLALQYEALVMYFQKTYCACTDKLTISGFALAGSSSSRKHGLATFVHDHLKWTIVDHLQLHQRLSGCAWTWMVIKSSMSTNLHLHDCKHLISQCSLTPFSMLAILIVCMSTGVIEPAVPMESALLLGQALTTCPSSWPKGRGHLSFWPWNTGTNPDLTFASVDPNSCVPDRCILEKFPRSQHQPLLIVPPKLARSVLTKFLNTLYATPRKSMFITFMGRTPNHVDLRALKKFNFSVINTC